LQIITLVPEIGLLCARSPASVNTAIRANKNISEEKNNQTSGSMVANNHTYIYVTSYIYITHYVQMSKNDMVYIVHDDNDVDDDGGDDSFDIGGNYGDQ